MEKDLDIKVISDIKDNSLDQTIFDLESQIKMLSSQADNLDYLVSIASGLLCGMLDILFIGDFNLSESRKIADDKVNDFVKCVSKKMGCKDDDIKSCVTFLEKQAPIPSDGNTPDFGGGLQHHLRDFAHHPTIVGLLFSLLTQFTEKSYGTDTQGKFLIASVPEKSKIFIGKDIPDKLIKGTITWFFHLISDIAGSSNTAGLGGGTGIPGPILSIAKEMSALPFFKNVNVKDDSLSLFLSKLFNGTLFAKYDENGKLIKESIVKMDFRGELGIGIELLKQSLPVIANECIVRSFYMIRRFAMEIKSKNITSISDFSKMEWNNVKPYDNPTLTRMLTIATGVFTTVDITEAIVTQKYFIEINYAGVGRFAVAIGSETLNYLEKRNINKIKLMYKNIRANTYREIDNNMYERVADKMEFNKFGLTIEQTEILYNIQANKTWNDIQKTNTLIGKETIVDLKKKWLNEWKKFIEIGFADFVNNKNAKLHWYNEQELKKKIKQNDPSKVWFRLVMLEAMLFEPYFPLKTEKDSKGKEVISKEYNLLQNPITNMSKSESIACLDKIYFEYNNVNEYVSRLNKSYDKVTKELNEVNKTIIKTISATAISTIVIVATAGVFAPTIATFLVGSQFAGLSGASLTSACLAYLGGGAVAAGGFGMAGGTAVIVGGSALLGAGISAGVSGTLGMMGLMDKKETIRQSAKLIVSTREIFLNDEHDIEYSNTVYEQYVEQIKNIENGLVELKLKADVASKEDKTRLKQEIKNAEESVKAMKVARKCMLKYNSSFEIGMNNK